MKMKKRYTRKQIIESIKYWKNHLEKMNESTDADKCIAITQVIMAYIKHQIDIDADYLLNQVYQMASTMTSSDEAFQIRDEILDGERK